MTNLQKKLEKWEIAKEELLSTFNKAHNGELTGLSMSEAEMYQYITLKAPTEDVLEHNKHSQKTNRFPEKGYKQYIEWRDVIKPKTEPQPVEVRVIKNEQL
jgi:hypothetical protein